VGIEGISGVVAAALEVLEAAEVLGAAEEVLEVVIEVVSAADGVL